MMATQRVLLSQPYGNRSSLVLRTLARQKDIKAVKRQFQAQGLRVAYMPVRDIRVLSDAYFVAHWQELIEEALETVSKSPALRRLYEQEKRRQAINCRGFRRQRYRRIFGGHHQLCESKFESFLEAMSVATSYVH